MIVSHRTLLRLTPDSVPVADVLSCRATVRLDIAMRLYRWHVTLPDGSERSGGCSDERSAVERAAWVIGQWAGVWQVAS